MSQEPLDMHAYAKKIETAMKADTVVPRTRKKKNGLTRLFY